MPRPDLSRYAPRVRIVDFGTGTPIGLDARLQSVSVSQVHTGVSTVTLQLGNQRFSDGPSPARPVRPPWAYDDLEELRLGRRIRVDFGYADSASETSDGGPSGGSDGSRVAWTPLIVARITDLDFDFPEGGAATLAVHAEDLLSVLKIKPSQDRGRIFREKHERQIVEEILGRAESFAQAGLTLATQETDPDFAEPLSSVTLPPGQSYLEFIQELAGRLDFELFVGFASEDGRSVEVHFERARSRGTAPPGDSIELRWERDLLNFKPTFQIWDQYTGVRAVGRDPRRRARVEGAAAAEATDLDAHFESDANRTWKPAYQVRNDSLQRENAPTENLLPVAIANLDESRATTLAQSKLLETARRFLTASASTIGRPELAAGRHVTIGGLGASFDGLYYTTAATHTLSDAGYRTDLSLRRTGMYVRSGAANDRSIQ